MSLSVLHLGLIPHVGLLAPPHSPPRCVNNGRAKRRWVRTFLQFLCIKLNPSCVSSWSLFPAAHLLLVWHAQQAWMDSSASRRGNFPDKWWQGRTLRSSAHTHTLPFSSQVWQQQGGMESVRRPSAQFAISFFSRLLLLRLLLLLLCCPDWSKPRAAIAHSPFPPSSHLSSIFVLSHRNKQPKPVFLFYFLLGSFQGRAGQCVYEHTRRICSRTDISVNISGFYRSKIGISPAHHSRYDYNTVTMVSSKNHQLAGAGKHPEL